MPSVRIWRGQWASEHPQQGGPLLGEGQEQGRDSWGSQPLSRNPPPTSEEWSGAKDWEWKASVQPGELESAGRCTSGRFGREGWSQ